MHVFSKLKLSALLFFVSTTISTQANSVSFDQSVYLGQISGQIIVVVNYDFTTTPMFGGGMDLYYDTAILEFVSYEQTDYFALGLDPQSAASNVGSLNSPGFYERFTVAISDFFFGVTDAGPVGAFVFNLIGISPVGNTPCGQSLCLSSAILDPMVTLNGDGITDEVFGDPNNLQASVAVVPVPGAIWLLMSSLIGFLAFVRH